MNLFKYFTLLVILVLLFSFTSCVKEKEPEDVLKNFISLVLRGYIDHAYELLSVKVKEKSTKEEFINALKIYKGKLQSFYLVSKKEEKGMVALKYEIVIVHEQEMEKKFKSTAYLLYEKKKWKILNPGF